MNQKIRTLIFGNSDECRKAEEELSALEQLAEKHQEFLHIDDLEEFDRKLVDWEPTLLMVLANGAEGMECTYRARDRRPCIPVFWFSNDPEFGMQSYRLNCAYFSTKPVTGEKLSYAFQRCNHIGIRYTA